MSELNVTTTTIASISSFGSWFSVVVTVGIAAVVLSILLIALTSATRYKKLKGFLGWMVGTLTYFFIGIATLVSLSVPILILYYFIKQSSQGNTAPLWITGVIVGGYCIVCLIGWLSKKFVIDRVKKLEKESKRCQP